MQSMVPQKATGQEMKPKWGERKQVQVSKMQLLCNKVTAKSRTKRDEDHKRNLKREKKRMQRPSPGAYDFWSLLPP